MGYGTLLKFLARYWLHLAIVAALVAGQAYWLRWMWKHGGDAARAECAQEKTALVVAALNDFHALEARRAEAQAKADKLAALPPKVIERVRQNPSRCDIPKPVADGLRDQIAEVNRAIREMP